MMIRRPISTLIISVHTRGPVDWGAGICLTRVVRNEKWEIIMEDKNKGNLISGLIILGVFLGGMLLFPWRLVDWGKIRMAEEETVTVSGYAEGVVENNVASFTASVEAFNDDKEVAVEGVNENMSELIEKVKRFGIDEDDIQTQSVSVYQREEYLRDDDGWSGEVREGQWRASNSIKITLREVDRASELATLLSEAGAVDMYGPRLTVDSQGRQMAEKKLMTEAVEDARKSAEIMAEAADKRLGEVVKIVESGVSNARLEMSSLPMAGGGVPIEIGSSEISKSIVVVFELR